LCGTATCHCFSTAVHTTACKPVPYWTGHMHSNDGSSCFKMFMVLMPAKAYWRPLGKSWPSTAAQQW
jgi:hypothetical protein